VSTQEAASASHEEIERLPHPLPATLLFGRLGKLIHSRGSTSWALRRRGILLHLAAEQFSIDVKGDRFKERR
jgi:hypothetical protein